MVNLVGIAFRIGFVAEVAAGVLLLRGAARALRGPAWTARLRRLTPRQCLVAQVAAVPAWAALALGGGWLIFFVLQRIDGAGTWPLAAWWLGVAAPLAVLTVVLVPGLVVLASRRWAALHPVVRASGPPAA